MKRSWILAGSLLAISVGVAFARSDELPEMPKPQAEHEWLQQLVGEWESEVECFPPGEEPVKSKGTESVRAVGGFWIVAENRGNMMGMPFTGLLTLGYDPAAKQYIGTWVDSMGSQLWSYRGSVDAARKALTLETEGPSCMEPGKTAKFKEVIVLRSPDHKSFHSEMQGSDGKWTQLLSIEYRRKK